MNVHQKSPIAFAGLTALFLLASLGCTSGPLAPPFKAPAGSAMTNNTRVSKPAQKTIQTVSYQEPVDQPQQELLLPEPDRVPEQQMQAGQMQAGQMQAEQMGSGQQMGHGQQKVPARFDEAPRQSPPPPFPQMQHTSQRAINSQIPPSQIYQTPTNPTYQQTDPWNVPPRHQLPTVTPQNIQSWEAPSPSYAPNGPASQRAGVNLQGSEFRIPGKTATELMIDLKDENIVLRNQVAALKNTIEQLDGEIQSEVQARKKVEKQLSKELHKEKLYRELIAELQVKVEMLETENLEIEQRADKALREIEANLDNALMDSLSKARVDKSMNQQNR